MNLRLMNLRQIGRVGRRSRAKSTRPVDRDQERGHAPAYPLEGWLLLNIYAGILQKTANHHVEADRQ
jgi:hypothetical protein